MEEEGGGGRGGGVGKGWESGRGGRKIGGAGAGEGGEGGWAEEEGLSTGIRFLICIDHMLLE